MPMLFPLPLPEYSVRSRGISAETALKLGKFFGVPPEFWMNLQTLYDIEEAQKRYKKDIESIHAFHDSKLAVV